MESVIDHGAEEYYTSWPELHTTMFIHHDGIRHGRVYCTSCSKLHVTMLIVIGYWHFYQWRVDILQKLAARAQNPNPSSAWLNIPPEPQT